MSGAVFMEYRGFTPTALGREYAFQVRFSPQDSREYVVTIAVAAFSSSRVSYQDGPNVCSSRLKRELAANPDVPTGTSFLIDEKEMDDHKLRQTSEDPKHKYRPKFSNA
jgi:hypothetical protein